MNLTNHHHLPLPLVEAIRNDDYDAGDSDITVTQLIDSPRYVELRRRHEHEITEDVADNIYALLGKSIHRILQDAEQSMLTERRLYTECLGWKVSGGYDRMALIAGRGFRGILQDYKVASVWEVMLGVRKEKQWQLNLLAELARRNGYEIDALENVFILRDWQKSKAKREKDYPQQQVAIVKQRLWTPAYAEWFLEERTRTHQVTRDLQLPLCTDEERWRDPPKWAVMKEGRKTALRVLNSKEDAMQWALENGSAFPSHNKGTPSFDLASGITIEHRPSVPRRCVDYCSVSQFCQQYQNEIKEGQ